MCITREATMNDNEEKLYYSLPYYSLPEENDNYMINLQIYNLANYIRDKKNKTIKQKFILFCMWLIGF